MSLSLEDRGYLEGIIDHVKNTDALRIFKVYKPIGATKENIIWYCKGYIYGTFNTYFLTKYQRPMNDSEISEFVEVVERRTNEIADVLTEYED